jgi:hypothetical protein
MSLDEKKKFYDAINYEKEDTSTSTYPEEVRSLIQCRSIHSIDFSMLISI